MKEKVLNLLVKWGNNNEEMAKLVEQKFDYVFETYPNARPSFLADVLSTLR